MITSKQAALAAAGGLVGLALATQAFAYSEAVISACTNDYLTYCSAYDENPARRSDNASRGGKTLAGLYQCPRCLWRGLQERSCAPD